MTARHRLLALCAAAACAAATAQTAPAGGDAARTRYEQERAACLNGTSHQDQATCLREAGAARDEARRGRLATPQAPLDANATSRCQALPEAERADCKSRVLNESNSTTKGSVKGGGVIKETTTRYVMTPEGEKRID